MADETEQPTAAEMELNHRHGPDRTHTILDEMRSPRTLFGRHPATVARTPGRDPPEVVTPDTRGRHSRPAIPGTNAMATPVVPPTDEPETTISFTNASAGATDGNGGGNLLDDAWLDTPDHLTARAGRNEREEEITPSVGTIGAANRYDELSDDDDGDDNNPGGATNTGDVNTTDPQSTRGERRDTSPARTGATQELVVLGRILSLRSPEWSDFCTRMGCRTIQHLVRLVGDADHLAATCDAATVDGHPLPEADRRILDELHEWVSDHSGGVLSTTHLLRNLTKTEWQRWVQRNRASDGATDAPDTPSVAQPTRAPASAPAVDPSHRFFAAAQALHQANRARTQERLPRPAQTFLHGRGRGHSRGHGSTSGRGRGQEHTRAHTPAHRQLSFDNRDSVPTPTRSRGAIPTDGLCSDGVADDVADDDPNHPHNTPTTAWTSPIAEQNHSEWAKNNTNGHDQFTNERTHYQQQQSTQDNYPGYCHGHDRNSQPIGRPTLEMGRSPPPTIDYQGNPMMTDRGRLIQRKLEASSIMKFDGRDEKFEDFRNYFHLQLGSRDIGYLLNPDFIQAWTSNTNKYDPSIAAVLEDRQRYVDQIKADNVHLFNLIGLAINGSPVGFLATSVLASRRPRDGIQLWQELLERFMNEDESFIKKHDLLQVLGTPMEKTEAIDKFLNRMEKAYGQLIQVCQIQPRTIQHLDEEFKYWVLAQIRDSAFRETKERLRDSAKDMTKTELLRRLRATGRTRRIEAVRQARRQARVAIPYPADDRDRSVGAHIVRRIAPNTWKGLDADVQKVISELRQENAIVTKQNSLLTTELKKHKLQLPDEVNRLQTRVDNLNQRVPAASTTTPASAPSSAPPKQYSSQAHLVSTAGGESFGGDIELPYDPYDDDEAPYDPYNIFADDDASLPPRDVTAALFASDDTTAVDTHGNDYAPVATIIDGGADTCVIGQGWRVTDTTMRTANVVGFDSRCFTPKPLPIGSACAIIDTDVGPIMVRVHEAVLNTGGVSLLSKFQIRDYGFTVDDTGAMHGGSPRMQIDDGKFIRLEMRKGLAVCMTRVPSDKELSTMAPLDLTADDIWDPRKYDNGLGGVHQHTLENNGNSDDICIEDDPLTVLNITVRPSGRNRHVHVHAATTDVTTLDPDLLTAKFIFRPRRVIKTTLEHTTAYAKGEIRTPLQRHIKSRFPQLNVRRLRETVASDTLYGTVTALGGYTCAQLFVGTTSAAVAIFPLRTESDGPEALQDYIRTIGAPVAMRTDNSKMQLGVAWKRVLRRMVIRTENTEPHHPWQNFAERTIGTLKRQVSVLLDRTGAPDHLWMLALEHAGYVWNRSSGDRNQQRTPLEVQSGDTPDISALLMYSFYEKVYYYDPQQRFPNTKEAAGWFVGVAENIGDALCYKILAEDGKTILHRSVVRPARDESRPNNRLYNLPIGATGIDNDDSGQRKPIWRDEPVHYDAALIEPVRQAGQEPDDSENNPESGFTPWENEESDNIATTPKPDNDETTEAVIHPLPAVTAKAGEAPQTSHPDPNALIGKLFAIDHDGTVQTGTVTDVNNSETETTIDLRMKADGATTRLVYSRFLDALAEDVHPFHGIYGHRPVNKAKGRWEVLILWGTGETTWEPLSSIWNADKLTVAKYARDNGLTDTKGWRRTKHVRGDPDRLAQLVRLFKASSASWDGPKYKFGVQVPRNTKEAYRIDRENGDTKWSDAIEKELKQIDDYDTFRVVEDSEPIDNAYKQIPYHMIYDVKFDLRRKARLVAGGNHTEPPKEDVYSGVVGMETIRLGFALAAMNNLSVCAADVGNAFLYGTTKEKVFIRAGPEFGKLRRGKRLIIVKSLYGLRSSSARYHEAFADTMLHLGYRPSQADPNLWWIDRGGFYEFVATYVDDLLVFARQPMDLIKILQERYILKGVGEPEYYLGANIVDLTRWKRPGIKYGLSAETYIGRIVKQFEQAIGREIYERDTPLPDGYHPELDETPILSTEKASFYRSITGALNWVVTLCRIDLAFTNQLMSRYNAAPRQGHLDAVLKVIGYIKRWNKGMVVFDPTPHDVPPHTEHEHFDTWRQHYPDAKEDIPDNMLEPKGTKGQLLIYVDADHAADKVTRRSNTGIIVYLNSTPIRWISKRQPTVESSTHGAELVAGKVATETAIEMRYVMRMMGVPMTGPTIILGDNNSVVLNVSLPSSTLKKKHNSVAFHRIREAVAARIITFWYIATALNLADLLTKILGATKHRGFSKRLLFRSSGLVTFSDKTDDVIPHNPDASATEDRQNTSTTLLVDDTTTGNDHEEHQATSASGSNSGHCGRKAQRVVCHCAEVLPSDGQSDGSRQERPTSKDEYLFAARGTGPADDLYNRPDIRTISERTGGDGQQRPRMGGSNPREPSNPASPNRARNTGCRGDGVGHSNMDHLTAGPDGSHGRPGSSRGSTNRGQTNGCVGNRHQRGSEGSRTGGHEGLSAVDGTQQCLNNGQRGVSDRNRDIDSITRRKEKRGTSPPTVPSSELN